MHRVSWAPPRAQGGAEDQGTSSQPSKWLFQPAACILVCVSRLCVCVLCPVLPYICRLCGCGCMFLHIHDEFCSYSLYCSVLHGNSIILSPVRCIYIWTTRAAVWIQGLLGTPPSQCQSMVMTKNAEVPEGRDGHGRIVGVLRK